MVSSSAVFEFEAALIDGWCPAAVRQRITRQTSVALDKINSAGLMTPNVMAGSIGECAREIGAAAIPLSKRFFVDPNAFFKAL